MNSEFSKYYDKNYAVVENLVWGPFVVPKMRQNKITLKLIPIFSATS